MDWLLEGIHDIILDGSLNGLLECIDKESEDGSSEGLLDRMVEGINDRMSEDSLEVEGIDEGSEDDIKDVWKYAIKTMDCRRAGVVLTLLPPKEGELARELLLSHSIRVNAESARWRQPSFVATARKRMRAMGSTGTAWISKGKHAFLIMWPINISSNNIK
jgi:hypothetical protein